MPAIQLSGYGGENRAVQPKLLDKAVGVISRNQRPGRGDFRPWRTAKTVATVPADRKTIYRMGRDVASDTNYWLSWPTRVHAVRGFNTEDATELTCFTGDGTPKVTNNVMALASAPYPTASRPLGVPPPATAPNVSFIDPEPSIIETGQPARTETLAPREITHVKVIKFFSVITATVWLAPGHGLVTGDKVTVRCSSHPSIDIVDSQITLLEDGLSFKYQVPLIEPFEKIAATGGVSKKDDTVFYEAIPGVAGAPRQTRFYVYTYANDWGWESAPSPVSQQVDVLQSSAVTISGFASPPSGNYQINRIRVYRTQAGASGEADFFFLREIALGTTSTTDDNRNLGEVLATKTWTPAPDDLKHLTALWNGMLAGISGNGVRFCEPYSIYAWPINYEILPPDAKPVALGAFEQILLVLTDGRPLVVTGSSPESMDQMPLGMSQGCVSADSVVSMGSGVAWASEDGLCWHGQGGSRILTAGLMLREDWRALKPSTIVGKMYEGVYFGSYDDGAGRKGFLIDPNNPTGIYFLDAGYEALHFDELQDQLYVLDGVNIKRWDAGDTFMTAKYRSKEFYHPRPMNYACAEVVADAYPVTFRLDVVNLKNEDAAKILAAIPLLTGPTATSVRFTWQVTSREPFRLPSGFMGTDWQVEIESSAPVQLVNVATSVNELANL